MRRPFPGLVLFLIGVAGPAVGQVPQPHVPDITERSGLLTRFLPIEPRLPPDPIRDTFYDTRWGDPPNLRHPLGIKNGGIYGLAWKAKHTASVYPYFYGSPGQSTIGPDSFPGPRPLRVVQSLLHPFKPVGMYYDQGSYVPIIDLHPLVPGPGPYPWPWYVRDHPGG